VRRPILDFVKLLLAFPLFPALVVRQALRTRRFRQLEAAAKRDRVWAAQVRRFLREPVIGDRVVTYDPQSRTYLIGKIASDAKWEPDSALSRVRKINWTNQVLRDVLAASTRNTLGAIQTVFRVDADAVKEMLEKSTSLDVPLPIPTTEVVIPAVDPTEGAERENVLPQSVQLIQDRIMRLSYDEVPELFAGILRAMGYKTRVSPRGPDRGVDIFASPDGLGLQAPRIFVEVKHRRAAMGAPDIRAFLGGRQAGDRCIYVSTGGFTREARYEADRSTIPLAGGP